VLILVMDTARADRCSVYGHPRPTTPALERLAEEAVVYEEAWAPSHWTPPSHATLLTGLSPRNHGCEPAAGAYLNPTVPTLAEILREAGYRTGLMANNAALALDDGLFRGFEELRLFYEDRETLFPEERTAPRTHEIALDWMRRAADDGRPFLLVVNDVEPHMPYTPPGGMDNPLVRPEYRTDAAEYRRLVTFAGRDGVMHGFGDQRIARETILLLSDLYDGEIAALDDSIGSLLSALRVEGLLDETLVVVTSDHGEAFDEHGLIEHSSGLYRYLLRVPLVIRYPGARLAGTRVSELVRLEDVLPTILELTGAPAPARVDGRSLLGDVSGRVAQATSQPTRFLLAGWGLAETAVNLTRYDRTARSVYDGRHHLIEYSDGRVELFEPPSDPLEQTELSTRQPDIVDRLRSSLGELPSPPEQVTPR
jgi:arylsulfatase A-like enzyme